MFGESYKPKFYKCRFNEIEQENNGSIIVLINEQGEWLNFIVDQSPDGVRRRIQAVRDGKKDKVYLTNGMKDVDISLAKDGKWQLFDEFDVYEFEMNEVNMTDKIMQSLDRYLEKQ